MHKSLLVRTCDSQPVSSREPGRRVPGSAIECQRVAVCFAGAARAVSCSYTLGQFGYWLRVRGVKLAEPLCTYLSWAFAPCWGVGGVDMGRAVFDVPVSGSPSLRDSLFALTDWVSAWWETRGEARGEVRPLEAADRGGETGREAGREEEEEVAVLTEGVWVWLARRIAVNFCISSYKLFCLAAKTLCVFWG